MSDKEELIALRRLAELEDKAAGKVAPVKIEQSPAMLDAVEPMSFMEKAALSFSKTPQGRTFDQIPSVRGIVQGGADLPVGVAQLLANAAGKGDGINRFVKDEEKKYQASRNDDGIDGKRLIGNLIGPGALAGALKPAASTLGRIWQGAGIGGVSGAANPMEEFDWAGKAGQTGMGLALGGILPGAWEAAKLGGRTTRNLVDPMLPGGLSRAGGRLANINAGDKADEIAQLLANAKPKVAGSTITAGEASVPANSAEFAAFQMLAKNANPSLYAGEKGVEGVQEAARLAALGSFGGSKASLDSAIGTRAANGKANYATAFQQPVKADAELAKIAANPYFQKALPTALDLAKAGGVNPKTDTTEFLQMVKLGIDKQLSAGAPTPLARSEQQAATKVKGELMNWLGKRNQPFDDARTAFAAESKPINEMQVGQFLQNKLQAPLENVERASGFAQAVRDAPRTIKGSTGSSIYDELGQVLQPKNEASANSVLADLQNQAAYKDLARSGLSAASKNIGVAIPEAPSIGMFNPKLSMARALINRFVGKESGEVMKQAGNDMLDPKKFAEIMKNAKPYERQAYLDMFMKMQAAAVGQQ